MSAAVARLRAGVDVAASVWERVAASHETRIELFKVLDSVGQLKLFPQNWRNWDAFAASEMVCWLCHPSELGREPGQLEKMEVLTTDTKDGEISLYVWRFRNEDDKESVPWYASGPAKEEWYAGVSGGYILTGEPRPLHGQHTFSNFEKWDNATPEGHASSTLEVVSQLFRGSDE